MNSNRDVNREVELNSSSTATELDAAIKELEEFSYSVAHDLRAPLRAIDGFSRILLLEKSAALSDDSQRYLRLIREQTQRMGSLIDDLVAYSRLNRQAIERQYIQPAEIARTALAELRSEEEREVIVTIHDMPALFADPALLKQVYANLLGNALKFTPGKAVAQRVHEIEVGFRQEEGEVVYFVKDNGVGFDMRYADRLFGMFQRMHRAGEYGGNGAGLAIAQRIIARHGGRVWAEAEVNKGAALYFTLDGGAKDRSDPQSHKKELVLETTNAG